MSGPYCVRCNGGDAFCKCTCKQSPAPDQDLVEMAIDVIDNNPSTPLIVNSKLRPAMQALAAANMLKRPGDQVMRWRPIEEAPHGKKLIVSYKNTLGKSCTVMATYYKTGTLEAHPDLDEEWAPEGWYEEAEAYHDLHLVNGKPTHFMPLPEPPQ